MSAVLIAICLLLCSVVAYIVAYNTTTLQHYNTTFYKWTLAVGRGSRAQGAVRSEAAQLRLSRAKCPGYVAKSAQRVGMF